MNVCAGHCARSKAVRDGPFTVMSRTRPQYGAVAIGILCPNPIRPNRSVSWGRNAVPDIFSSLRLTDCHGGHLPITYNLLQCLESVVIEWISNRCANFEWIL